MDIGVTEWWAEDQNRPYLSHACNSFYLKEKVLRSVAVSLKWDDQSFEKSAM